MSATLQSWVQKTRRRRGEHLPGDAFSPGLLDGAWLDPASLRRAVATTLVTLVGDRAATVTFEPGTSYAQIDRALVNVDGALVDQPDDAGEHVNELLIGVAAHEAGHILLSTGPGRRAAPLRRWLYNLVEDERIEVAVARRWVPLSAPLATTRRELLRSELALRSFLFALFYLVRAPDLLPSDLWLGYERRLTRAMDILAPFPETPQEVDRAVRRLRRLVPRDERAAVPEYPSLVLGKGRSGKHSARGRHRRARHNELSGESPPVSWKDAAPDPTGYATARGAAQVDAGALRAALLAALRARRQPAARRGILDRRRLYAWQYDDRLFRAARPAPREIAVVLILDLSGSMHGSFPMVRRVAVAFSEAVHGLPHVRLYVYGHAADGGGTTRTEITRFATPACGPVLSLGTLPAGVNNRDGHALEVIAWDLMGREPSRRRARMAIHVCDGDPCASGYRGLSARGATRKSVASFQRDFGPLVLLGIRAGVELDSLGAASVMWRDGGGIGELARVIGELGTQT